MNKNPDTTTVQDLVGLVEIADLLDVERETPRRWRHRGVLPNPHATVSGTPVWTRDRIVKWAHETGRWPVEVADPFAGLDDEVGLR